MRALGPLICQSISVAQHQAQPSEEAIASKEAASFLPTLLCGALERLSRCRHHEGMLPCWEGDGAFLISQHNAAIQGLRKAHESRSELPQPVTAGKRARICSATLQCLLLRNNPRRLSPPARSPAGWGCSPGYWRPREERAGGAVRASQGENSAGSGCSRKKCLYLTA